MKEGQTTTPKLGETDTNTANPNLPEQKPMAETFMETRMRQENVTYQETNCRLSAGSL